MDGRINPGMNKPTLFCLWDSGPSVLVGEELVHVVVSHRMGPALPRRIQVARPSSDDWMAMSELLRDANAWSWERDRDQWIDWGPGPRACDGWSWSLVLCWNDKVLITQGYNRHPTGLIELRQMVWKLLAAAQEAPPDDPRGDMAMERASQILEHARKVEEPAAATMQDIAQLFP